MIFLGTHAVQMVPERVSIWHWILIRYYSLHLPSILKSAIHLQMLKINPLQNFRLFYIYKAFNPRRMWLEGVPLKNYVWEFLFKGLILISKHLSIFFFRNSTFFNCIAILLKVLVTEKNLYTVLFPNLSSFRLKKSH